MTLFWAPLWTERLLKIIILSLKGLLKMRGGSLAGSVLKQQTVVGPEFEPHAGRGDYLKKQNTDPHL